MTHLCLEVASILEKEGIEVEVLDLRTLKPLDFNLISTSVKKTNRVVIVHEACLTGGFGGELAALIGNKLFDYLDAPIARVASKDVPMPFSPVMEDFVVPSTQDIVLAIRETLGLEPE